jgi:ActR/RegA family two-component response regulator
MVRKAVLIVDDDTLFCWAFRKELAARHMDADIANTGRECMEAVTRKRFDLVFLDIHLPDANGLDLLGTIRAGFPETRIMIVSGDGTFETKQAALSAGAEQFLEKPFDIGVVMRSVTGSFREWSCRRKHPRYLCRFPLKLSILSPLPGEEQFFLGSMDGVSEDIGHEGIRLTTEYPLRKGQKIRLRPAAEADPFSLMIPAGGYAEVVWGESRGDTSTAGLRFLQERMAGAIPARTSSPGTEGNRT